MGINFDNGSLLSACPGRNCNIDTFNELTINQHDCGLCNMQCIHCGACYWTKERNTKKKYLKCCSDGTIKLDPIHVPTPLLRSYMERTIRPVALHKNFFSKIRCLNTSVSFASCKFFILYVFKYNILRSYLRLLLHLFIVILLLNFFNFSYTFFIAKFTDFDFTWGNVPALRIQGVIKNCIGPLHPLEGERPLCLQAYFTEGDNENPYNKTIADKVLLYDIRASIATVNPMIISLKSHMQQVDEQPNIPRYNIVLGEKAPIGANAQLFLLPTSRELSAVIIDYDANIDFAAARKRREIVLQSHGGILQIL